MNSREDLRRRRVNAVNTRDAHERQNADREKTTVLTTRSAVGNPISMFTNASIAVSSFGRIGSQPVDTLVRGGEDG